MERRRFLQLTVLGAALTILGVAPSAAGTTHLSFLKENAMALRQTAPMTHHDTQRGLTCRLNEPV